MNLALKKYLLTVDDFNFLIENRRYKPTDRLELIEGEIFEKSPIGRLHARCVKFLNNFLNKSFAGNAVISVQDPVILDDLSEPQPDLAVLRFQADFYRQSHPHASDILLIIEVSDTTVEYDRSIKFPKYAGAGVPEAWLINPEAERVEVHSNPKPDTYGMVKFYGRGETVISETIPELQINTNELFGWSPERSNNC